MYGTYYSKFGVDRFIAKNNVARAEQPRSILCQSVPSTLRHPILDGVGFGLVPVLSMDPGLAWARVAGAPGRGGRGAPRARACAHWLLHSTEEGVKMENLNEPLLIGPSRTPKTNPNKMLPK